MSEVSEKLEALAARARWEGMVTLADGYERHVMRFGEGPEVVVGLHGGPGADLRAMLPLVEIAGERIEVILYTQLGGGRSSRPEDESLWTVETFTREFAQLVEQLELGAVHLTGQSWGGMLALECALAAPRLLRTLTVIDTLASTRAAQAGFEEVLAAASQATRDAVAANHQFDWTGSDQSEANAALLDLYATHLFRTIPYDLDRSRREFIELATALLDELGPAYMAMWGPSEFSPTGVLRDWDVSGRLGEIEVPALVACGLYDHFTLSCHREIVDGLGDADWLILGQSSHGSMMEGEADLLFAALRDFVLRNAAA